MKFSRIQCTIRDFDLQYKRVLLRADLNVPLDRGTVLDDFRLCAILPTLEYLQAHNAIIFLATHIGRPGGIPVPELSTQHLIPWFEQRGYTMRFADNPANLSSYQAMPGTVTLVENLRFFPGEQNGDEAFAHQLSLGAEYYVNDSFGSLHRFDTSTTIVANYFPDNKRTVGFLVEKELTELSKLTNNPGRPFGLVLGGGKVATKIKLIEGMLENVDSVFLCPASVFTFLYALKQPVGKSLVDPCLAHAALNALQHAQKTNKTIYFPLDYRIAYKNLNGPYSIISENHFSEEAIGLSIGPQTIAAWCPLFMQMKTIFVNAAMGFAQRPETMIGLKDMLTCIAQSPGYKVIGGGGSVAATRHFGLATAMNFLSTGGGATLAYLSGQPLPGLASFVR